MTLYKKNESKEAVSVGYDELFTSVEEIAKTEAFERIIEKYLEETSGIDTFTTTDLLKLNLVVMLRTYDTLSKSGNGEEFKKLLHHALDSLSEPKK